MDVNMSKTVAVAYNIKLYNNLLRRFFFKTREDMGFIFTNLTNVTTKFFILYKMCLILQGWKVDALLLNMREPETRLCGRHVATSLPEAKDSGKKSS